MSGAFFGFKPDGVYVLLYVKLTKKVVAAHPDLLAASPYPVLVRSYYTKTLYDDVRMPLADFNKMMKKTPANTYDFETPTATLVGHLSASCRKKYSAAWFDKRRAQIRAFLEAMT